MSFKTEKEKRDGCGGKAGNLSGLTEGLRARAFEPLDHLVGEAINLAIIEVRWYRKTVVGKNPVEGLRLILDVAVIEKIGECGLKFAQTCSCLDR